MMRHVHILVFVFGVWFLSNFGLFGMTPICGCARKKVSAVSEFVTIQYPQPLRPPSCRMRGTASSVFAFVFVLITRVRFYLFHSGSWWTELLFGWLFQNGELQPLRSFFVAAKSRDSSAAQWRVPMGQ